jgi:hypothetical protein
MGWVSTNNFVSIYFTPVIAIEFPGAYLERLRDMLYSAASSSLED